MSTKDIAKTLLKRFKPYFDESTGKLKDNAPESAVKAFEQFNELLESMRESKDYKKTPPFFGTEEQAEEWAKHQ